ncbi:hypothetical protein TNCT_321851 [Trichonephila clavata]|uniref:Uncharacterized protein n=1 Tax=Trichonephila clavata TaxID=2740835 RepID=A0A8X6I317_TRICU|nr:hypothetical protein TNCT_321851 [Trichonephila clavata]
MVITLSEKPYFFQRKISVRYETRIPQPSEFVGTIISTTKEKENESSCSTMNRKPESRITCGHMRPKSNKTDYGPQSLDS